MHVRGIKFGPYHSADWGLILTDKSISKPTPKTLYASVPGRDGSIDLSEELAGEIKYENRPAAFSFFLGKGNYYYREEVLEEVAEKIHGRKIPVILDDDPYHYLYARCTVTDSTNNKAFATIKIECNCEPWRYAINETVRTVTVNNSTVNLICTNMGIRTSIPEAEVTGNIIISSNGKTMSLTNGKHKLSDLKLKSGTTVVTVEGTGTLTFIYREGVL